MIEARAFSEFMASDQVEVHRKAHLVLNLNPGAGAWLTSIPNSSDTPLPFPFANGAISHGRLARGLHLSTMWTNEGPIRTHALSWVCGGDRVCRRNAVRDGVHSIARDAALSHCSRKNWGSSLPNLPVMETQIPPALPIQPTETSAAQPTFGFLAVPLGRQRPGTSPLPRARQFGPQQAGTPALFSSEWSLARPSYMALPLALALGSWRELVRSPGVPLLLATS